MKRNLSAAAVLVPAFAAVFLLGWWTSGLGSRATDQSSENVPAAGTPAEPETWSCPMHPSITSDHFDTCSICGMDLARAARDDAGPRRLAMSEEAKALARIETTPVVRRFLTLPVRLVGKVEFDETRIRTVAARVAGRLDRLFVDYTGIPVRTGDHLVDLYSPELITAQQELIEAKARLEATPSGASDFLRSSNRRGYQAAVEKLLLWGITEEQVRAIETRGTAEDHILIRSPAAGIVIEKPVEEGDYVSRGTPIYRIADLSRLWLQLDAYEQDLPWLRYGQRVAVRTEAWPGEVFSGWISFIDPIVDDRTRTVQVRVNLPNEQGRLKPGMFASAVVESRVGRHGQVLEPRLVGKWISPMHPEVVKDGPGQCDVCGMDLVPAETLLPGGAGEADDEPLVVPASAVLLTGTRSVVYVQVPDTERPTFEGREVVLGPRAGRFYVVRRGLEENEEVVVHGAFRVDSAMQIAAKPSMMDMPGEPQVFDGPETRAFRESLTPTYDAYDKVARALAADDAEAARSGARELVRRLAEINDLALPLPAERHWESVRPRLRDAASRLESATDIAEARRQFDTLSDAMLSLERRFGHVGGGPRFEAYCPMAFDDRGARWLQRSRDILNPYFGASMLRCGEIRTEFEPAAVPGSPTEGPKEESPAPPTKPLPEDPKEGNARQAGGDPGAESGPEGEDATQTAHHGDAVRAYLELQEALADDDPSGAARAFETLRAACDPATLTQDTPAGIRTAVAALHAEMQGPAAADLGTLRQRFEAITAAFTSLLDAAGQPLTEPLYRMHCPMAFDNRGADWIQRGTTLANPYFGASMLRCGSQKAELAPTGKR